ncbi:Hypothetical predicted protein [Mytilus galloprovincialis]|uniref:DZIP3-like HEPN domain-containing protein n=1 Tax=Mytilus galloprovincialis TaxID=29158 RepID=A0A8B6CY16_MYTGA|nr:Hypothetical predicted protein [Mytilus galloprovincialis]
MSLTVEESNFLRFYFLNLKIASKAVRAYFDLVHPPAGLANELANSSATLRGLRFISQLQLKILYPSPASNVRSDDFDTTLIVCLLRNMRPRETAPVTGWDNLPIPGDTSTSADIARVKWYRNKLAHTEDGKLSPSDFSQYWGDLEVAIGRLGGPSLLIEAQSVLHFVMDKSLTDILTLVRNCKQDVHDLQITKEEQTNMIKDLITAMENQKNCKALHENKMQKLNDSLKKGETEAQKITAELKEHKGFIDKSIEKVEAFKKEIEKKEDIIKDIQEKAVEKQNQIENHLVSLQCKFDKKFKDIDEQLEKHYGQIAKYGGQLVKNDEQITKQGGQLVKHDEQLATCEKNIVDMKEELHATNFTSDDTKALIENDVREGTFVTTKALTDGLLLLKQNGVLLITGHAGTGKSRMGRQLLHLFCAKNASYKCIKLNALEEWEDMVNLEDKVVVLIDDIFGETNCIYNREKDIPILDKVHAYVSKDNIKVIVTIRVTVKRQCQEVFDNHRLLTFEFIDLSSKKYVLSWEEKHAILKNYMKTVRQSDYVDKIGFVNHNGDTILEEDDILAIQWYSTVRGFPLAVYQFVNNDNYFNLGGNFFDRPTEAILEEINEIRRKGEEHRKFMIQYAVLVFTEINENYIKPDDCSNVAEVEKIIDAIYGETIKLKKCNISDAVRELQGSYLINIPNQKSYRFHHATLQESVILSFAQIDDENINKILPLISWSFLMRMVKPESYIENEGEVVLRIPVNSYQLLADKLIDIYMAETQSHRKGVLRDLSNTEIFKQDFSILLPCLFIALEREDNKDNHTENMIRCGEMERIDYIFVYMNNKEIVLSYLLDIFSKSEKQLDIYCFVLKTFNQLIKTSNDYFTINYMKFSLIKSLYMICSTKDVRNVKATLDIITEHKIPVILDQGVNLTQIKLPEIAFLMADEPTCVFLTVCIWNAYKVFNRPVLEFLLSKYNETPFDVNLYLKMIYRRKWRRPLSSLSYIPLKWIIERYTDQEFIDTEFILRTACYCQLFDTVEYLAIGCKTIDYISCLKTFIDRGHDDWNSSMLFHHNQELFNFLLTQIDTKSNEMIPAIISILQKRHVPNYIVDAFLSVCLNNTEILTSASRNGQFYIVNLIIENSHFQFVELQSALTAACMKSNVGNCFTSELKSEIEVQELKIVAYIVGKFGFKQFDLKAACQVACESRKFHIVEWFVCNIDITLFNVITIINSALVNKKSDVLKCILNKIEIASLDKSEVLKSVAEHYTAKCSTIILEIVRTIWASTDDKKELQMEEIVNTAYEGKCFELLVWVHENCNLQISIDARKLLMLACTACRVDVAKWVLHAFEQTSLDIDDGQLFLLACDKIVDPEYCEHGIGMVKLVCNHFQINLTDLKSGLLKLLSLDGLAIIDIRKEFYNLVVSILEKYLKSLCTKDVEIMINKSLDQKHYYLVNWFLEKKRSCSFDQQNILNKACADAAIETIKLLSKYFYVLDINQAMINTCISVCSELKKELSGFNDDRRVDCLNLLWTEMDHDSINIRTIVETVCEEKKISNNVMTWILLNLPHDRIPINQVLTTCCRQRKINHVKYIIHEVENGQIDIKELFYQACRTPMLSKELKSSKNVMLVDYLFRKLHDKHLNLSLILNGKRHDIILYFLHAGYCRNIDMKNLLKEACRNGHVKLVQWIVENVEHTELDIKYALLEAFSCTKHFGHIELDVEYHEHIFDKPNKEKLKCVVLLWHYIQDKPLFEIPTGLKLMTEEPSDMSFTNSNDNWRTWLLNFKNMNQKMISKFEIEMFNKGENAYRQSQQVYDGQCEKKLLEDSNHNNNSHSRRHCPSPMKT